VPKTLLLPHRGRIRQTSVPFAPGLGRFVDVEGRRFDYRLRRASLGLGN
jgi:hypothetical protein